jgi:hypothetical protein
MLLMKYFTLFHNTFFFNTQSGSYSNAAKATECFLCAAGQYAAQVHQGEERGEEGEEKRGERMNEVE